VGVPRVDSARRHRPAQGRSLVSEALFKDSLAREYRRAERFEGAFALVRLFFASRAMAPSGWQDVAECLLAHASDGDVIGWLEDGAVLGLIRVLGDPESTDGAASRIADIQQQIDSCLTADAAKACSIRVEIYSPQHDAAPPAVDMLRPPPIRADYARIAAKRALDVVGSLAFLLVFSPVFLSVALLVKLSSRGPVIFRQQRLGMGGRPFPMLKFRTMQVNADPKIHQQYVESFIQSQPTSGTDSNMIFKIVNDPRITPAGHFLRRSSLDEFPQFVNVLKGEMSLVGPRPPVPYEMDRYKRWHRRRVLEAKPGITGLWQVTGRSRTTFDEMVRLDLRYARTYTLWTDVKILLATPRAVLSGKGAY
jgi:lipopolysaccharide/colanic/teichoic acid biosynthesis glycosyltransferase